MLVRCSRRRFRRLTFRSLGSLIGMAVVGDMVDGEIGKPTWGVWLAHEDAASSPSPYPWVRVATLPAARHAQLMTMPDEQPDQAAAFAARHFLINVTAPELTAEQRKLYCGTHLRWRSVMPAKSTVGQMLSFASMTERSVLTAIAGRNRMVLTTNVDEVALIVIAAG